MYTLGALNRHFRFNRTKFYRSLLSQVTTHHVGITLNFYLRRVVEQSLPMFQNVFTPKFWRQWENLPDRRDGIARNVCGFFKFQVLFTAFKVIEKSCNEIEPQDIISARYELDKIFLPVFRQGFAHCQPREVSPTNIWQYLSKATDVFSKGHLPIFFSTGAQLSSFIAIPDEIHKVLPLIYPSEFATPLLNDDFEFGSTLNSENHQLESPCGLKAQEINQNILVCGDHLEDVQDALQQIAFSLLEHKIPMVIFDWNGTWSTPLGHYLTDHPTQRIEYFKIGQDVGISLFSLPKKKLNPHIPGNIEIAYITDIIRTFRLIYRWSDAEIALLQTVLGNASNPSIPMILADIKTFLEKNSHKSAVSALLLILGKDFLKTIFDAPLSPQFVVETWHNRDASIIINLQPLKDPQLKHLFVRLFLTQLLYTQEYFTVPDELLFPKSVVLPLLHNLWDERIGKGYLDSEFPLMTRMIKANHPLIASSHVIERVHPGVFGIFKSNFALRFQSPRSLKIISDILHLDDFYTNSSSSHGSNRHRSYQKRFLLHMDHNQALVVRPTQSFPYIFQFYQKVSMKPCTFPELLKCSQLMTPVYVQKAVTTIKIGATPLERDFIDHGNLIPILYNLLTTIKEKQKILEVIARSQLKEDLFALMTPIFQESTLIPMDKQKLCETIVQQLIDKHYLQPKVIGTNRSTQQEGFELGLVAIESLDQHQITVAKNQAKQEKIEEEKNNLLTHGSLKSVEPLTEEDRSLEFPHPTSSPEFIDGAHSLLTRLTTMFIFGTSRWKNEGIAASYWQMHMDLTNVEEHLSPLTDKYSVMVLDALQRFHRKLEENPPEALTDSQYGALLAEYEIIPIRLG
jgi:hypothetical protein